MLQLRGGYLPGSKAKASAQKSKNRKSFTISEGQCNATQFIEMDLVDTPSIPTSAEIHMACLTEFSNATMKRLLDREAALGIGLEEVVLQMLDDTEQSVERKTVTDGLGSFDDAKAVALARARDKQSGEEFRLEELFTPEEWKRIPARRSLGRYFRKDAEHDGFVTHVGKNETNHAIYQRR